MKKSCSMLEYQDLAPFEREALARDFLELARSKYPDAEFGINSFPELDYAEIVLGNLLAQLEDWGYTIRVGRMARFKKVEQSSDKTQPHAQGNQAEDISEVERLVRDLRHHDWQVRTDAAEALQSVGDERAVKPLIRALQDPNWRVRNEAAFALGKIGDLRAIDPLILAMEDQSGYVRWAAAWALGELKAYRAVPRLIKALDDGFEDFGRYRVREEAAGALGEIGDEQAVEPLKRVLKSENESMREAAEKALEKI